jgi:hypothetical protein
MTTNRRTSITLIALLLVGVLAGAAWYAAGSDDGRAAGTSDGSNPTAEAPDGSGVDVATAPGTDGGSADPASTAQGSGRPGGQNDDADGSAADDADVPDAAPGEPGARPAPPCLSAECLGLEPRVPVRVNVDLVGPTYAAARLVRCTPRRVVDYYDFIVELEITGVNDPSGIRSVGVRDNLTMDSAGGGTYRRGWSEPRRGGSTTIVITDNVGNRTTVPVQWPEASCPAPPA